jgi:hypothetical protein
VKQHSILSGENSLLAAFGDPEWSAESGETLPSGAVKQV